MLLELRLREPLTYVFYKPKVISLLFIKPIKLMLGRIKYERLNVDKQLMCAILIPTCENLLYTRTQRE
jgi:hypothetical protein